MKSAAHQYEDRLLEFAYGELPQHEADAVDAHVRGCTRCSQSLSEIKSVRATMAQLPLESAPQAGLESLLAYAAQAAQRSHTKTAPSLWKRFLMPLASVMALVTVGVVAFRANEEFDTSPASAVADAKLADLTQAKAEKKDEQQGEQGPPADALARQNQDPAVAPLVVAAAPQPAAEPEQELSGNNKQLDGTEGKNAAPEDLRESGGKRGDVWAPEPKRAPPQSVTRRAQNLKTPPVLNDEQVAQNYSDVGLRGSSLSKDSAPPPPPPPAKAPAQDKVGYGLGTPGGLDERAGPVAAKPSPANQPLQEAAKEKAQEEVQKPRAKSEEERPAPAPVAGAPSSPPPSSSSPQKKAPPKGGPSTQLGTGLGVGTLESRSSPGRAEADDDTLALEKSDSLGVNRDAKFAERQRESERTRSLESARVASSRGDRLSEIRLSAQVLQSGASGSERVEALKRICDAYEFLGEPERADPFCDQLLQEFPTSVAARAVEDRRKRVQRAAPSPRSNAADRKALDAAEQQPAEAAPSSNSY